MRGLNHDIRDGAGPSLNDGSIGPDAQSQPACASL
jgi:hypothetical protein